MAKNKNKELKQRLDQAIRSAENPWEMQKKIQDQLQQTNTHYYQSEKTQQDYKPPKMPDYDINQLMEKLGDKMPPGMKQIMGQFINIIPNAGDMDNPQFKKEMKKKMKNLKTMFKSPYE